MNVFTVHDGILFDLLMMFDFVFDSVSTYLRQSYILKLS